MYRIFTDTSANLPAAALRRYSLSLVALGCRADGEDAASFTDENGEFDGHAFYERLRGGADAKTTMANPQLFLDAFRPALGQGEDVLYVGMSSGISGTYHASTLAAAELREAFPERRIVTIDTRAASLGEGLPVLTAARAREAGCTLEEAEARTRAYSEHICQYFTVADLRYLQKGGRISRLTARIGSVLNIKPILRGNEAGEIVMHGKVRGLRRALEALADACRELCADPGAELGIAHADAPEDAAQLLAALRAAGFTGEATVVCYEPVTGSHVGPGAVALFFPGTHR